MLLYIELKRLYFTYAKAEIHIDTTNSNLRDKNVNLGSKPKILLKHMKEDECDPNDHNLLDTTLIYLA